MTILAHHEAETHALPGLLHQTVAGPRQGLARMEVWKQALAPGAATPLHKHDCEEAVLVLSGEGRLELEGEVRAFGADTTLIVPPGAVHRIANVGPGEMRLIGVLAMAPVVVQSPDGAPIPLPWS